MKSLALSISLLTTYFGILLAPAIVGRERLAFRDVSHFYTPLYGLIQSRISSGQLPLWNDLDQFGIPVAGETTTAVFYPGKLVFHIGLDVQRSIALYVLVHLVLAGVGTFWIARRRRFKPAACHIAAICYASSGPVLFLYCNPPFLVGAAWVPLAFGALYECIRQFDARALAIGSLALAMMILGGDGQTALNTGLVLLMIAIVQAWRLRTWAPREAASGIGIVACALLLACLASAVQVVPSVLWSRTSVRNHSPPPGVAGWTSGEPKFDQREHWWQPPRLGSHQAQIYDYSVGPWQWAGIFLPRVCGDIFPINTRITRLLPAEGRTWTPSLFLGILPGLCLIVRLRNLRRRKFSVWDALVLVGLLVSLGGYGLVWAIRELAFVTTGDEMFSGVHSAIGGVYWLLVTFVPGYAAMRFPAKWLVFFCFGGAMLTAQTVSTVSDRRFSQLRRASIWVIAVALVSALATFFLPEAWGEGQQRSTDDAFFGPLDVGLAITGIRHAAFHSIVVCIAVFAIVRFRRSRAGLFVGLTFVELFVASWGLVGTTPNIESAPPIQRRPTPRILSQQTTSIWPAHWLATSSTNRLAEVEQEQQTQMFMRWHLASRIAKVNGPASITHWRSEAIWAAVRQSLADNSPNQRRRKLARLGEWLAIDEVQPPSAILEKAATRQARTPIKLVQNWQVIDRMTSAKEVLDCVQSRLGGDPRSIAEGKMPIPSHQAVSLSPDDGIRGSKVTPELFRARVSSSQSSLIKLCQLQDGNWYARYRESESEDWTVAATHPVDVVSQGFVLPAGVWEVEFRYSYSWLIAAGLISLLGWLTAGWLVLRPKRVGISPGRPSV